MQKFIKTLESVGSHCALKVTNISNGIVRFFSSIAAFVVQACCPIVMCCDNLHAFKITQMLNVQIYTDGEDSIEICKNVR